MVTTLLAQAEPTSWPDVALFAIFFGFIGFFFWAITR